MQSSSIFSGKIRINSATTFVLEKEPRMIVLAGVQNDPDGLPVRGVGESRFGVSGSADGDSVASGFLLDEGVVQVAAGHGGRRRNVGGRRGRRRRHPGGGGDP